MPSILFTTKHTFNWANMYDVYIYIHTYTYYIISYNIVYVQFLGGFAPFVEVSTVRRWWSADDCFGIRLHQHFAPKVAGLSPYFEVHPGRRIISSNRSSCHPLPPPQTDPFCHFFLGGWEDIGRVDLWFGWSVWYFAQKQFGMLHVPRGTANDRKLRGKKRQKELGNYNFPGFPKKCVRHSGKCSGSP